MSTLQLQKKSMDIMLSRWVTRAVFTDSLLSVITNVSVLHRLSACSSGINTTSRSPLLICPTSPPSLMSGRWRTRCCLNKRSVFMGRASTGSSRWWVLTASIAEVTMTRLQTKRLNLIINVSRSHIIPKPEREMRNNPLGQCIVKIYQQFRLTIMQNYYNYLFFYYCNAFSVK